MLPPMPQFLPHGGIPFDSTFKNFYGERWWSKIELSTYQLIVWGNDVHPEAKISPVGGTDKLPWVMNAPEQLWLRANLQVVREMYESFRRRTA
jgi:hypothetical protein